MQMQARQQDQVSNVVFQPKLTQNTFNKVHDQCKIHIIGIFIGFKFIPIILYLVFKLATDQYLSTFMIITLLVSSDFWFTKNIAGRQLAALIWYSKLNQDNKQKWYFVSSQTRVPYTFNVLIFWIGQFVPILFWLSILLINLVTLSIFWIFLAIFCCLLLSINFGLFLQCKGDHQKKVNGITKRVGLQFYELSQQKN